MRYYGTREAKKQGTGVPCYQAELFYRFGFKSLMTSPQKLYQLKR